jgi:hypothetical protein
MTAEQTHQVAEGALQIATPKAPDIGVREVAFQLDDDDTVLHATRPKQAVLMKVAQATIIETPGGVPGMAQIQAYTGLMDKVFTPETIEYLNARWDDDDDDLDMDCLDPIFTALVGLWYGGPTGSQAASARSRPRSGKRSTARARSGGSTR